MVMAEEFMWLIKRDNGPYAQKETTSTYVFSHQSISQRVTLTPVFGPKMGPKYQFSEIMDQKNLEMAEELILATKHDSRWYLPSIYVHLH